jgi:hypothetical protein
MVGRVQKNGLCIVVRCYYQEHPKTGCEPLTTSIFLLQIYRRTYCYIL